MSKLRFTGFMVVFWFFFATLCGAVQPNSVEDAPVLAAERTLPSGARVLLRSRPGTETVLVAVVVDAGSQDEPAQQAGLSHYLEHLLFDGYDELDERAVTEAIEASSAYVNAFTREQTTVFFGLAPVGEANEVAGLLNGMLTRSRLEPEVVLKERGVILEEIARELASPPTVDSRQLRELLWSSTPLARPVSGTPTSVENTEPAAIEAYWKERYAPAGWRVLVMGDLPVAELEEIAKVVADAPEGAETSPRQDPLSWPGWGTWRAADRPDPASDRGPQLSLVIAVPDGVPATAMEVFASWLGGSSGPLAEALVPTFADQVGVSRLPRRPRELLQVDVEVGDGIAASEILARVLGLLEASAVGPGDSDVTRLHGELVAERALTGQRLHYAAVFYGEDLAAARGPLLDALELPAISPGEVRAAAKAVLGSSSSRVRAAWLGPGGPDREQALPDAIAAEPLTTSSSLVPGPGGSLVTTLANGLVVGILPEQGSSVFGLHLLVADRSLREPDEAPGVADLLHRLLAAGSGLSDSRGLDRRLGRAGIDVKTADSPAIPYDNRYHVGDFSYVRMEGPGSSLNTGLAILAEMIRGASWDEAGWAGAVDSHRSEREADNRGSAAARQDLLRQLLGNDHPLARPVSGPADGVAASPEMVTNVWGRWPGGWFAPDGLILTIASPAPPETVLEVVEDLFKGGADALPRRGPYPEAVAAESSAEVPEGDSTQVSVAWGARVNVAAEDRAPLLVALNVLSDRLVAEVREKEGLAYGLGAGVRVLPDGAWLLSARVGTRPVNQARVEELVGAILVRLGVEAPTGEDLHRIAARNRRGDMLSGLAAVSRAYRLGRQLFDGPTAPSTVSWEELTAVTGDEVLRAAQRYLRPDGLLLVVSP